MIKKFIKRILGNPKSEIRKTKLDIYLDEGYVSIGEGTLISGSNFTIRKPEGRKSFITIGKDSIINGNFIIENESGNIVVGDRTFIGGGSLISVEKIEIGNDVLISWGGTFMDNNAHSLLWKDRISDVLEWKKGIEENNIGVYKNWANVDSEPIIIKDKAWIGFEVVILKGVTIGEGSVVAARSVVTKDVPDYTVVAGNPARFVKNIKD